MGAGTVACPALRVLLERDRDEVVAVVTQPDRPSGRRRHLKACPVKAFIEDRSVPVIATENVSAPEMVERLSELSPDLIIVADFGQFLKSTVLEIPPKGCINIHPSLLPRYRGAAPIQWAIANGDDKTGVTVLYVTPKMDAGDIIEQEEVPLMGDETAESIEPLLAELGATLVVRALDAIRTGTVKARPQNEADVVYAPKLKKEDGRIDWSVSAEEIANRVRGFMPWPGCYCEAPRGSGHMLKIRKVHVEEAEGEPGMIVDCGSEGPLVACGEKGLRLIEVQPEGKKPMSGGAYLCGHALKPGAGLS